MKRVQASWNVYTQAFGAAMVLLYDRAETGAVLHELQRARDALNEILDGLPPEGLNPDADISRGVAESLRENVDAVSVEVSATRQ